MKNTYLIAVLTLVVLISGRATQAQQMYNGATIELQKESWTPRPTGSLYTLALLPDGDANAVSPKLIQVPFHTDVPDSDIAFVTVLATNEDHTPDFDVFNDAAFSGTTRFIVNCHVPSGTTVFITAFCSDTLGGSVEPWSQWWHVATEETGVVTYKPVEIKLNFFPNPIVAGATVELPVLWKGTTYHVTDVLGREVILFNSTGQKTVLPATQLAAGNYFLTAVNPAAHFKSSAIFTVQ